MRSVIDKWADFLANEKLTPQRVPDPMVLVALCEELTKDGPPCILMHKDKLESRRKVVAKAMDMSLDLTAIRYYGKVAMGRGLLDAWNLEYQRRFGSIIGTAGEHEVKRRGVSTRLSERSKQ